MPVTTRRIVSVAIVVADLARAEEFYVRALGFEPDGHADVPDAIARLFGATAIREARLRRGGQALCLRQMTPGGAPYPAQPRSCDQSFQHCALPVTDMRAAASRLPRNVLTISRGGAQTLPPASGGATALKLRDVDGHPVELIQFPDGRGGGIDHSAIVVADAERSIAFYRDRLGFALQSRQLNVGPEQDRLDDLDGARVEVIALAPAAPTPHLELLAYRDPPVRATAPVDPVDIAATVLVLEVDGLADGPELVQDPDGHRLLLLPP